MQNKEEKKQSASPSGLRSVGLFTMIPMVMVAGLLVGYFFGTLLDKTFGWTPWGKIILSVLGVTAGFKQTIHLIQEATREK